MGNRPSLAYYHWWYILLYYYAIYRLSLVLKNSVVRNKKLYALTCLSAFEKFFLVLIIKNKVNSYLFTYLLHGAQSFLRN